MLTFGSLFAGIGGFDLGFERAGMRCIWQVEKDNFCRRVLAKHWPDVERYEDVRYVGRNNLSSVDVICGGFPCQPHSYAGKRKGAADDRDLWPEYRRIIAELKPAYIVGENVPGIVTTILDTVLSDLENLDYTWQTFVIPACAVDAPHRRDRVFIVAYAAGQQDHAKCNEPGGFSEQRGPAVAVGGEAVRPAHWKPSYNGFGRRGEIVADTNSDEQYRRGGVVQMGREWNTEEVKKNGHERRTQWGVEPGVGRVANGVPHRVDRLRSLGNAVVPQVAEFIGRLIVAHATGAEPGE